MKTSTPEAPKPPSPLKILLMGPPGSRKTTLGLQFPDVHVIDCDRNLDGPDKFLRANGHQNLSYTYDDIRGETDKIEECYNLVCDKLKLFSVDESYKKRKTVFVDSLSHVNEFIIRHVLQLQGKKSKSYEMEPRDWSPFKSFAYILLVARLEETKKTVLCTAHEISLTRPDPQNIMMQQVIGVEPFFQGKVGDTIGAFFGDVWRLEVRQVVGGYATILQTQATPKCQHLKNSLSMPPEVDVTKGISALDQYLKGRI